MRIRVGVFFSFSFDPNSHIPTLIIKKPSQGHSKTSTYIYDIDNESEANLDFEAEESAVSTSSSESEEEEEDKVPSNQYLTRKGPT